MCSIHDALPIYNVMRVDSLVLDDNKERLYMINPSTSGHFTYYRAVNLRNWKSYAIIHDATTNELTTLDTTHCDNIEDLRLFKHNDELHFIGYRRNPDLFETHTGYIKHNAIYPTHTLKDSDQHIKNIVPLQTLTELYFIDIHTKTVYDSTLKPIHTITNLPTDLPLYGSTRFIHLSNNIFGALVHNSFNFSNRNLIYYYYYWVELDITTWSITFVSKPFIIYKLSLVFVSDICKITDSVFEILFGYKDRRACKGIVKLEDLRI